MDLRDRNDKYDLQLSQAKLNERRVRQMFEVDRLELIECKDETWQWRRTGHVAIEFENDGKPSGILTTEADHWVHTLHADDGTVLVSHVFPLASLRRLFQKHVEAGHIREGGDNGRTRMVLIPYWEIVGEPKW